jgi:hypothetical protein
MLMLIEQYELLESLGKSTNVSQHILYICAFYSILE